MNIPTEWVEFAVVLGMAFGFLCGLLAGKGRGR